MFTEKVGPLAASRLFLGAGTVSLVIRLSFHKLHVILNYEDSVKEMLMNENLQFKCGASQRRGFVMNCQKHHLPHFSHLLKFSLSDQEEIDLPNNIHLIIPMDNSGKRSMEIFVKMEQTYGSCVLQPKQHLPPTSN